MAKDSLHRYVALPLLGSLLLFISGRSVYGHEINYEVNKKQPESNILRINPEELYRFDFNRPDFKFNFKEMQKITGERDTGRVNHVNGGVFNQAKSLGCRELGNKFEEVLGGGEVGELLGRFVSDYVSGSVSCSDSLVEFKPRKIGEYAENFLAGNVNKFLKRYASSDKKEGLVGVGAQIYNGLLNCTGFYREGGKWRFGMQNISIPVRIAIGKGGEMGAKINIDKRNKKLGLGYDFRISKLGLIRLGAIDVEDPYKNSYLNLDSRVYENRQMDKHVDVGLHVGVRSSNPYGSLTVGARF